MITAMKRLDDSDDLDKAASRPFHPNWSDHSSPAHHGRAQNKKPRNFGALIKNGHRDSPYAQRPSISKFWALSTTYVVDYGDKNTDYSDSYDYYRD